jgi:endonuclease V-like protein UPF0215 family
MSAKRFRSIKREIRILGIDDGVFTPHAKGEVDLVGIVYRGGHWFDGVMRTRIAIDGLDATEKIASMIVDSPHYDQLRVIILDGVTFGGFNVVNMKELFRTVNRPVIAVTRERPDFDEIEKALKNLPESEKRWAAIKDTGEITEVRTRKGEAPIYMQVAGIARKDAEEILRKTSTRSNIPEALRVAHIVASGLTKPREH